MLYKDAPFLYPCKYCKGIGEHYRMGKLETCFACKGNGIDVECYEVNKDRNDGFINKGISNGPTLV